jgi:PAS domain-containing protein
MAGHPIEIILMRQLAESLAVPVFVVDTVGDLVFYNEPAEQILGRRFVETGEMSAAVWATMFQPTALDGTALAPGDLPLTAALLERRPGHSTFCIRGLDGMHHDIHVSAFPLVGAHGVLYGAVAMFWKVDA